MQSRLFGYKPNGGQKQKEVGCSDLFKASTPFNNGQLEGLEEQEELEAGLDGDEEVGEELEVVGDLEGAEDEEVDEELNGDEELAVAEGVAFLERVLVVVVEEEGDKEDEGGVEEELADDGLEVEVSGLEEEEVLEEVLGDVLAVLVAEERGLLDLRGRHLHAFALSQLPQLLVHLRCQRLLLDLHPFLQPPRRPYLLPYSLHLRSEQRPLRSRLLLQQRLQLLLLPVALLSQPLSLLALFPQEAGEPLICVLGLSVQPLEHLQLFLQLLL